jgi:hypothetical protein
VADGGPWTAGEDCGGGALECGPRRPADRIDAAVDAMETADLDTVGNSVAAQTEREQLLSGDIAVLPIGDPGYFGVDRDVTPSRTWKF